MDVAAERFFRNMVRIVVGTLVEVGRARVSREDLARALHSGDRSSVGPTAPPHGLFLLRVEYD
jgi:tRNA pseudouridine38-40 synthase